MGGQETGLPAVGDGFSQDTAAGPALHNVIRSVSTGQRLTCVNPATGVAVLRFREAMSRSG